MVGQWAGVARFCNGFHPLSGVELLEAIWSVNEFTSSRVDDSMPQLDCGFGRTRVGLTTMDDAPPSSDSKPPFLSGHSGDHRPPVMTLPPPKKKGLWGPIALAVAAVVKFGSKLLLLMPFLKFLPAFLKTGGTMILSVGAYALLWGWKFALGFVVLIFVHELGHLVAARSQGLRVGAPVFIPFMGAFIALKDAPRNAWIEAVGIGGPIFGTIGASVCFLIHVATGDPFWSALAYSGFMLNLFNLAPVGFLDGGRIVTALSPWLWVVGYCLMIAYLVYEAMTRKWISPLLIMILIMGLPRLISLFRARDDESRRFFEIEPRQRWTVGIAYFGLIALLALGMTLSHVRS
jgi:Zn-dependent protease